MQLEIFMYLLFFFYLLPCSIDPNLHMHPKERVNHQKCMYDCQWFMGQH